MAAFADARLMLVFLTAMSVSSAGCGATRQPLAAEWASAPTRPFLVNTERYCASAEETLRDQGYEDTIEPLRPGQYGVVGVDRAGFPHRIWLRFALPERLAEPTVIEFAIPLRQPRPPQASTDTGLAEPLGAPRPLYDPQSAGGDAQVALGYALSVATSLPERGSDARVVPDTTVSLTNSVRNGLLSDASGTLRLTRHLSARVVVDPDALGESDDGHVYLVLHSDGESTEPLLEMQASGVHDEPTAAVCFSAATGADTR